MHLKWKRFHAVPKKAFVPFVLLLVIFLYSWIQLAHPPLHWMDKVSDVQLQIENVRLADSFSTKGSRMKLIIEADDQVYYLWYPTNAYMQYSQSVKSLLFTGEERNVTAKIVDNTTLWDCLTGQHKIVDLRSNSAVFYEIQTEINRTVENHHALWILLALSGLLWTVDAIYICLVYGIVAFKAKK